MTLAVVTPGDTFTGGFLDSMLETMAHCIRNITLHHVREYSADIYNCRESAAIKVVDHCQDYDAMLWVDSDMVWRWDDVVKLVEADVPIVSGVCMISQYKCNAAVFRMDGDDEVLGYFNGHRLDEMQRQPNGLILADLVGFGFILFKKGVFESLERPWFRQGKIVTPYKKRELMASEDMMFTNRCREAGYPIYVHPEVKVGHQKRQTLRAG